MKRAGGRRYYRPSDMALLGGIKKLLHEDGLTIRGVQKVCVNRGSSTSASLAPSIGGEGDAFRPGEGAALPEQESALLVEVGATPGQEGALGDSVAGAEQGDLDDSLNRFPFVDEPEAEPEEVPEVDPGPVESAVLAGEEAESAPEVIAFVADVPDTDPEDDAPEFRVALGWPCHVPSEVAFRLQGKAEELAAIQVRAVALRKRMREGSQSRADR